MALKMKIGKSVYDALPDDVKKEYKQTGDDYTLDLDGYEDPAELRRARDHEKQAAADAKREAAAEKRRADDAEKKARDLEGSGKSVDDAVKAKETELTTKFEGEKKTLTDRLEGLTKSVINGTKNSLASALANKISTSPSLLQDKLAARIDVEIDENTHEVKHYIIGSDGKRSASTMDDLEKEALKNKEWAPILRGTRGNGGGGAPSLPGGGGAPRSQQTHTPGTPPDDLTKLPPSELAARITAKREAEGRA